MNENVQADRAQKMPGRGAYCCIDGLCCERFHERRKKWKYLFRL